MRANLYLILFVCFSIGLPIWAMQANKFEMTSVHGCSGDCYLEWEQETGGIVALSAAQAEARAAASPVELGKAVYAGCIACHGSQGEGGVGPALVGQSENAIYEKLVQYKNGETRGSQSALMWSQSSMLSEDDMKNVAAFLQSLAGR